MTNKEQCEFNVRVLGEKLKRMRSKRNKTIEDTRDIRRIEAMLEDNSYQLGRFKREDA